MLKASDELKPDNRSNFSYNKKPTKKNSPLYKWTPFLSLRAALNVITLHHPLLLYHESELRHRLCFVAYSFLFIVHLLIWMCLIHTSPIMPRFSSLGESFPLSTRFNLSISIKISGI